MNEMRMRILAKTLAAIAQTIKTENGNALANSVCRLLAGDALTAATRITARDVVAAERYAFRNNLLF